MLGRALTSANTQEENDEIFAGLEDGSLRLLYLAPERLGSAQITSVLRRYRVGMISVDEAHCVSQWGHDFRPDYLKIGELRRQLGVPLSAFTATADAETRAEIVTRLFDDHPPKTFLRGFDRPNIHLAFAVKNNPRRQIVSYADARRGQSGIVYCGHDQKPKAWQGIGGRRAPNLFLSWGMDPVDRRVVEERFNKEEANRGGHGGLWHGVDKPDIRWVAHADLPKSIEAYYQEIGRGA